MGSIPLPALDLKTPQQPDLLEKYGQLQTLRNQSQQIQLQQQEAPLRLQQLQQGVQSGGVQLQQQTQALKDQQAKTAAMSDWDGSDINKLYPLILKHGGSSDAVMSLKSGVLEQQQKAAVTFKDMADGGKAQVETLKQKGDLISGALSPLIDPARVPDAQLPQALQTTVQDLVSKQLLDPQHAQAAQQLVQQSGGDPAKIRQGLDQFIKTNMAQSQIAEQAHQKAMEENAAEGRTQAAANAAETAKYHQQEIGVRKGELGIQAQKLAVEKGDPNAAAQLLVNGDATLSELKARGSTPKFIADTLAAAHQLSGGKYNAQAADAQFSVAKSPTNVAFFGSAKSLIDKGGTLDQLAEAGKAIPGGLIPAFNSIADWEKAASGSGPIAKYASIALGVADDYSKVMGGGQGSDSSRQQALQLVGAKQSPAQRAASIDGIRGAVGSQTNSRIGNNPVLKRMYGDAESAPGPSGMIRAIDAQGNLHQAPAGTPLPAGWKLQ